MAIALVTAGSLTISAFAAKTHKNRRGKKYKQHLYGIE